MESHVETIPAPLNAVRGALAPVSFPCKSVNRAGTVSYTHLDVYKRQGDLCKQYIMQALMDAGCGDGLYGALYQRLFKRGPKGEPPVAPLAFPTADPAAAVRCIVRAGGKAVLAHPGQYDNFAALPALVQAGLWGIEAYHPKHRPGDIERCLKLAHAHGLGITGGSDFHGRFGEGEAMGECGVASLPFL